MTTPLTFGSLFAGIGGFDLGFERAGMVCKWQVEIDEYATRVLEKHWPDVRRWDDVRTFPPESDDWRVDCVVGGFPCQDISYAGKGAGLDGERSGLFYEAMRVVRQLEPRYVVLENVAALLTRGLPDVLGTLASLGFDAEWHCIPAAAIGAPHIRDRVFIIGHRAEMVGNPERTSSDAYAARCRPRDSASEPSGKVPSDAKSMGRNARSGEQGYEGCSGERRRQSARSDQALADTICTRLEVQQRQCRYDGEECQAVERNGNGRGWWATEPDVGRVANGVPSRVDRLRGLGNAIVPQVAEWIGRRIVEAL